MAVKAVSHSAAESLPWSHELPMLSAAVQNCRGCNLYRHATQAVFGEMEQPGRSHASIMLVGEQPGDKEDVEGRPFVGPLRSFWIAL